MKDYPNFYENLNEAHNRINRTVVLYGDIPCFVFAITDHKGDGIFRTWLAPIGMSPDNEATFKNVFLMIADHWGPDYPGMGPKLDKALEDNPDCGIMRKHMNSPAFNRFRPFPLGMCNVGEKCFYVERQPIRPYMHQGLVKTALLETPVTSGSRKASTRPSVKIDMYAAHFRDCVLADHHSPYEVLKALLDPEVSNDAHAFHREFALVRGPLEMMFLAYRTDIVGVLPNCDFSVLRLGREFHHCREAVSELNLFDRIC